MGTVSYERGTPESPKEGGGERTGVVRGRHGTVSPKESEDRIGTGPPRARTEIIHVDLGFGAIPGSIKSSVLRRRAGRGAPRGVVRGRPVLENVHRALHQLPAERRGDTLKGLICV